MLHRVFPDTQTLDLLDLYSSDERSVPDRPWVMANMVSSIDGATAIGGRSTGLSHDDDHEVFRAIRAVPDVILVGAGTVTAENYAPVTLDRERRQRRVALGKTEVPTLAIVSGRLSIDPQARLFSDPEHKPLIITSTMADPSKLAMLGDAADVAFLPSLEPESILGQLGATAIGGRSTGLSDDDDHEVFRAIRAVPDVILVGAGTVTAENYAPVTLDRERRQRRVALGKTEVPTLAIVSGRLSIDPQARLFSDPEHKPLIITSTMADPSKLAMLGDAADVAFLPSLEPESILGQLGAASVVLLEGGPTLNAQFAGAGLVDEMNLTLRSAVVAGDSKRITNGADIDPILEMTVDRVLQGDRSLFIRYLKT